MSIQYTQVTLKGVAGQWVTDGAGYIKPATDGDSIRLYDSTGAEFGTISRDLNYLNITAGTDSFGIKFQVAGQDILMATTSYTNLYMEIRSYNNTDLGTVNKPFKDIHASETLKLKETATPNAVVNWGAIYTKNDNKLYFQDGAGNEHEIAFV